MQIAQRGDGNRQDVSANRGGEPGRGSSATAHRAVRRSNRGRTGNPRAWVFVDDLDAHLAHARSRGATILSGIRQHGYRAYEAADLEANRWTFAQARPTM